MTWLPMEGWSQVAVSLQGTVIDANSRQTLPFATIRLKSVNGGMTGTVSNEDGAFKFPPVAPGKYRLLISYIGYQEEDRELELTTSKTMVLPLKPLTAQLSEVVVTASESKGITSASKIDKTAMEHLQPTSFTDLLALIPGNSTHTPDMSAPNTISLREVGTGSSDYKTSALGTQFVIDGSPISTDAQMQYVGTEITQDFASKTSVNTGVDMRNISTDNIEQVEIIRGIPSVEYGDLTSGVVIIRRKQKATPLEARFKADQYSKLFSVGKGVEWQDRQLVVSLDGGFLSSQSDPRNALDNFKRMNFSARVQKKWYPKGEHQVTWNTTADYSGNIDSNKNDPEILSQPVDRFRSTYHSMQWQNRLVWKAPVNRFFKNLSLNFTASYTREKIDRTRFVQLDRDRIAPINMKEGEYDAAILPYTYTADLTVDGQPLNFYANAKAVFGKKTGNWSHHLVTGLTWTYARNLGDGQVYDLSRPLNPIQSYSRPRSYRDIPAGEQLSFFAEDKVHLSLGRHLLEVQAGLRAGMLLHLNPSYYLHNRIYVDPRVNIQWRFPGISLGKHDLNFSVSGGVGSLTKMPTLLQLYPNKIYQDFVQLDYWSSDKNHRRINVRTYIVDPTNYNLKAARNLKWEARFAVEYARNELSVTYFRENMSSGFRSMAFYAPYEYKKYDASGVDDSQLAGPPSLENMPYEVSHVLSGYGSTGNGSRTLKEGVEFQFSTCRLPKISTRLTINGAWFRTTYENSEPLFDPVSEVIQNQAVSDLYVGLYENDDNTIRQQFNTNFIVDTWLEKLGVKLSETIECMWFQNRRNGQVSGVPLAYMDVEGKVHPYTDADRNDLYRQHLVRNYNAGYFVKDTNPFYLYVNFKVTKDFGKHVSISLFADRILDYVPDYKKNGMLVRRTAFSPYFGMELNVKL